MELRGVPMPRETPARSPGSPDGALVPPLGTKPNSTSSAWYPGPTFSATCSEPHRPVRVPQPEPGRN
eukprot:646598-Pyramimonas_sp.AAC.1